MASKKIALICAALSGLAACATKRVAPEKKPTVEDAGVREIPNLLPQSVTPSEAPAAPPAPVAEQKPPEAPKPEAPKHRAFGVWIDGAGLDAMLALGFLQEMEKAGLKPIKVVGTGFGCWIALSWALENNSNRAEWQSFKWTSWDSLGGGLLNRLAARPSQDRFDKEIRKLFPASDLAGLKLPADCPLADKGESPVLSSVNVDVPTLLWHQFQVPALGGHPDAPDLKWYSGLLAGPPTAGEIEAESTGPFRGGQDFAGWIILRTRGPQDRAGSPSWMSALAGRADLSVQAAGKTDAVAWVTVNLADRGQRPIEEIRNFDNRRRWLLEGRHRAQMALQGQGFDVKKFLEAP